MKRRKNYRTLFVVLLAVIALLLAGCGNRLSNQPGNEQGQQAVQNADKSSGSKAETDKKTETNQPKGFQEYPIGDEKEMEGLKIAAVYFQPVEMEPAMGLPPEKADIHLEADISATPDNKTGFGIGEWVPYLTVKYKLKNLTTGQATEGNFMPMNASDGPHYGDNVKMLGAGKYELTFIIESPEKQHYMLHTDKETGVEGRFWQKPLEVKWEFDFVPRKW